LVVVSHTKCAHVGNSKKVCDARAPPPLGKKHAHAHMYNHTKFRRSMSDRLCVGRGPKIFGDAGPTPLGQGLPAPRNTLRHNMSSFQIHVSFIIPTSFFIALGRTVLAQVGVPKTVGSWSPAPWMGAWVRPLETRPCPTTHQISSFSVKTFGRDYRNPPENVDHSRPAFLGQSGSLELTLIDRLPMTSY